MAKKKHWSEISGLINPLHERVRIFNLFDGFIDVVLFDEHLNKEVVSKGFMADRDGFMTKTQFDRAYMFALGLSAACSESRCWYD